EDSLRRRLAHADTIGNSDALIGIPRQVQPWNRGHQRFEFRHSFAMAYRILRHGARPAVDAREFRLRAEAGDLLKFTDHRVLLRVEAADEAAGYDLACGDAMRELGAHPRTRDQAAALFLWDQKAESVRWPGEVAGVEAERH